MNATKNPAAVALGSIRTEKKARTSAENGKKGGRPRKYILQHVGYPVAGRRIADDEWKVYSTHATESAAWKAVKRAKAHLEPGQWDDHYRVLDPDGAVCDYYDNMTKIMATGSIR